MIGADGFVAASHLVAIGALLGVFHVGSRVRQRPEALAIVLSSRRVGFAALLALVSLVIERCYHLAARALSRSGLDLLQAHPAPEVLALAVAGSIYALAVTAALQTRACFPRTGREAAAQGAALLGIWVFVAVLLA